MNGWQASTHHRAERMSIDALWLVHRPHPAGDAGQADGEAWPAAGTALHLDTCLRRLALGAGTPPRVMPAGGELRVGGPAYRHTLEIISGLHSAVPGETNVLGQFRSAWRHAAGTLSPATHAALAPLVTALLADSRTLHHRHLQGIGGQSYGSLVRRLLAPGRGARVLFIGTGALARSLRPFFDHCTCAAWNHRTRSMPFAAEPLFAVDEMARAAAWAQFVIFATPADDAHDGRWRTLLRDARIDGLVHLGRRRTAPWPWPAGVARHHDLDDVFDLATRQAALRTRRIVLARHECLRLTQQRLRPVAATAAGHFTPAVAAL